MINESLDNNGRTARVLHTVVELYVSDGAPVSSQAVIETGKHPCSTATIRNHMAELERTGYLAKPHTSAGRMPTDEGYRWYVDNLDETRTHREEIVNSCRARLRAGRFNIFELMSQASKLLGDMSENFAVIYGLVRQENRVTQLRLVRLSPVKVLAIAILDTDFESITTLRLDREVEQATVEAAESTLNERVAGKTIEDAKAALTGLPKDNVTDEGVLVREVAIRRDEVFSEPPAAEMYYEEQGKLLNQPEFLDPKVLQLVLKLLHNKDYLMSILAARQSNDTQVTIGSENGDDALHPFSLITAGYRVGAARGVLGIIGPTRMRYDLGLALVHSIARELRAIGEERF